MPDKYDEVVEAVRPFVATSDRTMTKREHQRLKDALAALGEKGK